MYETLRWVEFTVRHKECDSLWRVDTGSGTPFFSESWPSELLADTPAVEASKPVNSPAIPDSSPAPVVAVKPTAPIACTATGCDRLREVGRYANRAGLCTDHVAEKTRECKGGIHVADIAGIRWATEVKRAMRLDVPHEPRIDGDW